MTVTRRDAIEKAKREWLQESQKGQIAIVNHFELQKSYGFIAGAEWADANPDRLPTCSQVHVQDGNLIVKLEQKLAIAWNALQEVKESGIVDCPECNAHERIVEQALAKIEEVKS